MSKVSLIFIFLISASIISNAQTISIGSQVWTTKNLDVATFRNGDPIPQAKTNEEWKKAGKEGKPAWCYYENDPANGTKYGKLYNWYAVNDPRGLAPVGYHIPSDNEWTKLDKYLGSDEGIKMKSTSGWKSYTEGGSKTCPNCASWNAEYRQKVACHTCKDTRSVPAPKVTKSGNGMNSSGFSGLPGGNRNYLGTFNGIGGFGLWWSSTENDTIDAWTRGLNYSDGVAYRLNYVKEEGLSVRCLRD